MPRVWPTGPTSLSASGCNPPLLPGRTAGEPRRRGAPDQGPGTHRPFRFAGARKALASARTPAELPNRQARRARRRGRSGTRARRRERHAHRPARTRLPPCRKRRPSRAWALLCCSLPGGPRYWAPRPPRVSGASKGERDSAGLECWGDPIDCTHRRYAVKRESTHANAWTQERCTRATPLSGDDERGPCIVRHYLHAGHPRQSR